MARKEANLMTCGITQALQPEYFKNLNDNEKAIILSNQVNMIVDMFISKLEATGAKVAEAYGIIHDMDSFTQWDEVTLQEVVVYKTHHIHIVIKFATGSGMTLTQIANAVGLEPQFIDKPQRGKFAYDNMLAYLIHIKYPAKFQYDPKLVYTARGESYTQIYHNRKDEWLKGRAKIKAQSARVDVDWLEEKILTGEVDKSEVLLTDDYYAVYGRNKRRCDDAFNTYAMRKMYQSLKRMENGDFRVSVIYISGNPGVGKSAFTSALVKQIEKDVEAKTGEVWSHSPCASNNPFDNYNGEEILVMDDVRGASLDASDWLKLLDPEHISYGSARYQNKLMACRVVIIDAHSDILDFFSHLKDYDTVKSDNEEPMDQFFRRVMAKAVVYRVPDDFSTRRVHVSTVEEVQNGYTVASPARAKTPFENNSLCLHYQFNPLGGYDIEVAEALHYLSALVMKNNKICDDDVQKTIDDHTYSVDDGQKLFNLYLEYCDEVRKNSNNRAPYTVATGSFEQWYEHIYLPNLPKTISGSEDSDINRQKYDTYLHKCYDDYNNTFKDGYCGQSYDEWLNDNLCAQMRLSYPEFLAKLLNEII